MNNFSKIKAIYEYLGWEYCGWNDPNNQFKCSYFAPKNTKRLSVKYNVHFSPNNDPTWTFIIQLANLLKFKLNNIPYDVNTSIDEMYEFVIKNK
jgi:hypothetical protein